MQAAWKWGCHFDRIKGGREELERALREVIKYSARAVAEKSLCLDTSIDGVTSAARQSALAGNSCSPADASRIASLTQDAPSSSASWSHAPHGVADSASGDQVPLDGFEIAGRPLPAPASGGAALPVDTDSRPQGVSHAAPPAMCDWSGQELLEWLQAFRGFRRTRTYKQLFRLPKPEPDSLAGYLWVGTGKWVEKGYRTEVGPFSRYRVISRQRPTISKGGSSGYRASKASRHRSHDGSSQHDRPENPLSATVLRGSERTLASPPFP